MAGVTLTGTTMAFVLIMIVSVISIDLTTIGSMEGETGSMILGIGEELPIGIELPVTALDRLLRDRFKADTNLVVMVKKALIGKPLNP